MNQENITKCAARDSNRTEKSSQADIEAERIRQTKFAKQVHSLTLLNEFITLIAQPALSLHDAAPPSFMQMGVANLIIIAKTFMKATSTTELKKGNKLKDFILAFLSSSNAVQTLRAQAIQL